MRWMAVALLVALSSPVPAQTSSKRAATTQVCESTAHRSATVQVDEAEVRRVREPVVVRWHGTGADCRDPAFLVIAVPPWTRPKGEGFFAIAPASPGPFGINPWPDSTRLIVPLNLGRLTRDGSLALLPYRAALMSLRWKVVTVDPKKRLAKDVAGSEGTAALNVPVGPPVISIQDPFFSSGPPRRSVLAPDQKARLDDYGAYFRLVDSRTSEPLYESAGSSPRFSPTGRFIYYLAASGAGGKGDSTALQVFDRELGDLVISRVRGDGFGQDAIVSVRWAFGDSILALGTSKGAIMETHTPLIDRPPYSESLGPNCCTAIQEKVVLEVDWDNLAFGYSTKASEAEGYNSLLFSPGEDLRKLSPSAGALLDELKRRQDRDPENETNPKAPDGRTPDEITEPLAAEVGRLLDRADVADTTVDEYPASAKWDFGGHTIPVANIRTASGGQIKGHRDLDQLLARPFGNLQEARQGAFLKDHFAQRLIDLGFQLMRPAVATAYAAPNRDDFEKRDGRWISRIMSASMPLSSTMIDVGGYCSLMGKEDEGGKTEPVQGHDALDARHFDTGQSQAWLFSQACSSSPSISDYQLYLGLLVARNGQAPTLTWLNDKSVAGKTIHNALDLGRIAFPAPLVEAQIFGRHLVFAVGDRADVVDYDMESGSAVVLHGAAGVPHSAADRLYRTIDGRIIRLDMDGGIHLYSTSDGAEYLQGRYVDDEFVLYSRDGFFDGTDEGARYVYLRFAGQPEPASLSQFRASLRDTALIGRASTDRRSSGQRPNLQPPPTVDAAIGAGERGGAASVDITASSPVGLAELRVFLDGRLIRSDRVDGTSIRRTVQVLLSGSARWITVQCVDRLGTDSMLVSLPISATERSAMPKGHLHTIAAGTDLYDDPHIRRLYGAGADARAFLGLVARSKLYDPGIQGTPIVDSPTMRHELLSRLGAIASAARPEDTTMILLSGHGLRASDGRLFLATKTTRTNDLERTALSWVDVADALKAIPGRVMVFLDVCHAGAAGASNEAASALLQDWSRPILVLSASKGRQSSLETAGAGVFTGTLKRLLAKPEQLDADNDGAVELQELYRSLKRDVQVATDGAQTPWVARNGMVGPIPMF